jgi:hypothetical protein
MASRSSSLMAGCRAEMRRSVAISSSVPLPVYARLRADAREGRDGTLGGTIIQGDGSSAACAPVSTADLDSAARFGMLPEVPVKLRALPSSYAH